MLSVVIGNSYDSLLAEFQKRIAAPRNFETTVERVLAPEWVITPSLGTRQWLTAQVSKSLGAQEGRSDGVVANWSHEFPGNLTSRVLEAHLDSTYGLQFDPWLLPQLQFTLFDWASQNVNGEGRELLLSGDRVSLARCRQVANLFDAYFTWRPEMIDGWLDNSVCRNATEVLQAKLLRSISVSSPVPPPCARWSEAWSQLPSFHDSMPATDRVSIFGLSTFPGGRLYINALVELAKIMDVALFLVDPFEADVVPRDFNREFYKTEGLRLLGGGAASRAEMTALLCDVADHVVRTTPTYNAPDSMLGALQKTFRNDEIHAVDKADASILVHETHGIARQAEVLRDAILHQLNETEEASPISESEILVVCPNLSAFEGSIRSAFDSVHRQDEKQKIPLSYRVVDRHLSRDGAYLQALRHFLTLMRSRCSRAEVLSFASEPDVKLARGFTETSYELFSQWSKAADVRWGLNTRHRAFLELPTLGGVNTWEAGLRRITLGAFVENPRLRSTKGILPVEVAPGQLDDLIRLTSFIECLEFAMEDTWEVKNLAGWLAWYDQWSTAIVSPDVSDEREYERVLGAVAKLRECGRFSADPFTFTEFVDLIEVAFEGIRAVGSLLTGGVVITTPESLSGVPFKTVYILGFDDESFTAPDFPPTDLRRLDRQPGDSRPSDDARDRLLEIMLSASERIVIIRSGTDVTTNKPIDHSVVFSEFLDAVREIFDGELVTTAHPRNSFSPANFDAKADFTEKLRLLGILKGAWSYSSLDYRLSSVQERSSWAELNQEVIPEQVLPELLNLTDIAKSLKDPPKVFVNSTLGIWLSDQNEDSNDLEVSVERLLEYELIKRLWEEERADLDVSTSPDINKSISALINSGFVPPAPLIDKSKYEQIATQMAEHYTAGVARGVKRQHKSQLSLEGTQIPVDLEVVEERDHDGTITSTTLVEVLVSKLSFNSIIDVWPRIVALRATVDTPVTLHLVVRPSKPKPGEPVISRRFPIQATREEAFKSLASAARFYRQNLYTPITFVPREDLRYYENPLLTEEKWSDKMDEIKPYLGSPYWNLALGHLTADDVMADGSNFGHQEVFRRVAHLLNQIVPLFDFAKEDGNG